MVTSAPSHLAKPAEAARFYNVHVTTLRRWVRQGDIPVVRIGHGRRQTLRIPLDHRIAVADDRTSVAAAAVSAATARTTRAGASEAA